MREAHGPPESVRECVQVEGVYPGMWAVESIRQDGMDGVEEAGGEKVRYIVEEMVVSCICLFEEDM